MVARLPTPIKEIAYIGPATCLKCIHLEKHTTHTTPGATAEMQICGLHAYVFRKSITALNNTKTMGLDPLEYVCRDFKAPVPLRDVSLADSRQESEVRSLPVGDKSQEKEPDPEPSDG